jgi:hypothetical protein
MRMHEYKNACTTITKAWISKEGGGREKYPAFDLVAMMPVVA